MVPEALYTEFKSYWMKEIKTIYFIGNMFIQCAKTSFAKSTQIFG